MNVKRVAAAPQGLEDKCRVSETAGELGREKKATHQ